MEWMRAMLLRVKISYADFPRVIYRWKLAHIRIFSILSHRKRRYASQIYGNVYIRGLKYIFRISRCRSKTREIVNMALLTPSFVPLVVGTVDMRLSSSGLFIFLTYMQSLDRITTV